MFAIGSILVARTTAVAVTISYTAVAIFAVAGTFAITIAVTGFITGIRPFAL